MLSMGATNGLVDGWPKAAFGTPPAHALPPAPVIPAIACDALQKAMLSCERIESRVLSLESPACGKQGMFIPFPCSHVHRVPAEPGAYRVFRGLFFMDPGALLRLSSYGSLPPRGGFYPGLPVGFWGFPGAPFSPHPLPPFPLLPLWVCGGDRHKAEVKTAILSCLLFLQATKHCRRLSALLPMGRLIFPLGIKGMGPVWAFPSQGISEGDFF